MFNKNSHFTCIIVSLLVVEEQLLHHMNYTTCLPWLLHSEAEAPGRNHVSLNSHEEWALLNFLVNLSHDDMQMILQFKINFGFYTYDFFSSTQNSQRWQKTIRLLFLIRWHWECIVKKEQTKKISIVLPICMFFELYFEFF